MRCIKFFINYILKTVLCFLVFFIFSAIAIAATASHSKVINILTWWGYLNYPEIVNEAEKKCGVKISFDEYYSNDEFLRRWHGQNDHYDIIIFSDTISKMVKNKIPNFKNSTLWQQSSSYNKTIKIHYDKGKYPHNVVYFIHSLTGFLWNPKNITLSNNDSVISIFNKAKQQYVIVIDDSVEEKKMIEESLELSSKKEIPDNYIKMENFKKVVQNSTVYVANGYCKIYEDPKFAFSFTWSGEAVVSLVKSNKSYKFLIHPRLSYIASDLLAQTTNKKDSFCVAKFLSSRKGMSILQNKDYYFSPYADYDSVDNPVFKKIYKKFVTSLPLLTWIESVNEEDFQKINRSWQLIKLSLSKHIK